MQIRAKYSAKCRYCREQVRVGWLCHYEPGAARGKKITCVACAGIRHSKKEDVRQAVYSLVPQPPPLPPGMKPNISVSPLIAVRTYPLAAQLPARRRPPRRVHATKTFSTLAVLGSALGVFLLCLISSAVNSSRPVYRNTAPQPVAAYSPPKAAQLPRSTKSEPGSSVPEAAKQGTVKKPGSGGLAPYQIAYAAPPAQAPLTQYTPAVVLTPIPARPEPTYRTAPVPAAPAPALKTAPPAYKPNVAENGSYYGQPNAYGVPKTVHVSGYFRKDGTYVRGHYRSRPHR